jgi:hypothetical protein
MKLKVIITGATGMVGEGVLAECLTHPDVEQVLTISRKSCGRNHPGLTEVIQPDFFNFSNIDIDFREFHACFFCLGVSSIGMKETTYRKMTYELTMQVAETMAAQNPAMVFCYVSGAGTDSSEQGRRMWARVKGKTENALIRLFKNAYMFRPGLIRFYKSQKNIPKIYLALGPLLQRIFPKKIAPVDAIARAMIRVAQTGYDKPVLEVNDILKLSREI